MPLPVRIELTERWGYALEFGGYLTHARVDELETKPGSANARVVALAASDPKRYPLFVLTDRPLGRAAEIPEALRDAYYVRDAEGRHIPDDRTGGPSWRTVCPLAPDAIFAWAARGTVEPLLRLAEKAPLAVILNGGEYGLSVAGHSLHFWEQSPAVVAAKGGRSWLEFVSAQKARQEGIVSDAVRKAFPGRRLYLWYHFAGIPSWTPRRGATVRSCSRFPTCPARACTTSISTPDGTATATCCPTSRTPWRRPSRWAAPSPTTGSAGVGSEARRRIQSIPRATATWVF